MSGPVQAFDLTEYARVLWRRKLLIILCAVLAGCAALVLSLRTDEVYRAQAEVLIVGETAPEVSTEGGSGQSRDNELRLANEIEFLQSDAVQGAVNDELGYRPDVSVTTDPVADVLIIAVSDGEPAQAAQAADAVAAVYIAERRRTIINEYAQSTQVVRNELTRVRQQITAVEAPVTALNNQLAATADPVAREALQAQIAAAQSNITSELVPLQARATDLQVTLGELRLSSELLDQGAARLSRRARVPQEPVEPDPVRDTGVALAAGLLIGIGLAYLRDHLDDSIRSAEGLETASGASVLGIIPHERKPRAEVLALADPQSAGAEAYRSLRTSVQFLLADRGVRSLLVTSAQASEGKTTTACNLAVVLASAGMNIALVDGDLRRPRVHELFGLAQEPGLTTALVADSPGGCVQPVEGLARLVVMTAGPTPTNPSEMLVSSRVDNVVAGLAERYDLVIVDSPPVVPISDAVTLARKVDAVVLVSRAGRSSRRSIRRAVGQLAQVQAHLVGCVLNDSRVRGSYYGGDRADYRRYRPESTSTNGEVPEPERDLDVSTPHGG